MADVDLVRVNTERTQTLLISEKDEADLLEKPVAILWDNAGLIGLIPKERVANLVLLRRDKKRATPGYEYGPLCFCWSDVVELEKKMSNVLLEGNRVRQM